MKQLIFYLITSLLSFGTVAQETSDRTAGVEWQDVGIIEKPFTMASLREGSMLEGEVIGTVSVGRKVVEVVISSVKITCTVESCRNGVLVNKVKIWMASPQSAISLRATVPVDLYSPNRRLAHGETVLLSEPQRFQLPFASYNDLRKLTLVVELSGIEGHRLKFHTDIHGADGLFEGHCPYCLVSTLEGRSVVLEPDDAFVIVRASGDFSVAWFANVNGKDTFMVDAGDGPKLVQVKAGWYYLKTARSIYQNFVPANFDAPTDTRKAMEVRAGAVTYLGDWTFNWIVHRGANTSEFSPEYRLDKETIETARRKMHLETIPLFISRPGAAPVQVKLVDQK